MSVDTLRLRVASLEDAKRLYDWSQGQSRDTPTAWGRPVWEDHLAWLELTIGPTDQLIFIGEAARTDQAIGAMRFEAISPTISSVAIIVAPEFRGRGWSRKLLQAGLDHFDEKVLVARIPNDDPTATALFVGLGFQLTGQSDGVGLYRRQPPSPP